MASTKAVIIVPTQGMNADMFQAIAKVIAREVYAGKAKVVKTKVTKEESGALPVEFTTHDGKPFSFDDVHDLITVLTISHGFSMDGPNLAYMDGGYQPWNSDASGALSTAAKEFWGSVGDALIQKGKIVLCGCFMGKGYAKKVSEAARVRVYGSNGATAAANLEKTKERITDIEAGKTPTGWIAIPRPA
jgi:hypothetical protein